MTRPSVSLSDLEIAADLARRLKLPRTESLFAPTLRCVQFSRGGKPSRVGAAAEPPSTDTAPAPNLEQVALDSWEVFLAWSLELTRSRAGFVVDSQGFVIASRGNVPKDGFDGIGAELCYAMDQLDRISPEAGHLRVLELGFTGSRIIGLKVSGDTIGPLVIGFLGSRPLTDEVRDQMVRQLELNRGLLP